MLEFVKKFLIENAEMIGIVLSALKFVHEVYCKYEERKQNKKIKQ